MVRLPTHREPTHPSDMLREEFLLPIGISPRQLAEAIHLPEDQIDGLLNHNHRLTPGLALRLSKYFGTTPDFWLNLQLRWDLYHAQKTEAAELATIQPYSSHPPAE